MKFLGFKGSHEDLFEIFAPVQDVTRSVTPYIVRTRIYFRIMKQPNIEVPKHRNTGPVVRGPLIRGRWFRGPLVAGRDKLNLM